MTTVYVLRVFANDLGEFGNPVGIVVDEGMNIKNSDRINISKATGFSETVFINNIDKKSISIYNPQNEISFAGHAVVGVVSFLQSKLKKPIENVYGINGIINSWSEKDITWVKTELRNTPPWWHERLNSAAEIDKLDGPLSENQEYVQLWAWINERKGIIRSRTFAPGWDIPEDEANGSGCMRLAAALGRSIVVHHGKGSIIYAKSSEPGWAEVGGRVVLSNELTINFN